MENLASTISIWIGLLGSFATIIISYTKTKQTVEQLSKKFSRYEKTEDDLLILQQKVNELEKRQNEDRVEIHEKFEKITDSQSEMSNCLKEVSTILAQFDKQITSRLDRLERKIDTITLK